MSVPASPSRPVPRFLTVSLAREIGLLLALSVLFPFMIHVLPVPGDSRLGPRLLPMFYAPLLAVLLGRAPTAFLVAGAAPWLNWALTGHPAPGGAAVMTVELLGFVTALRWLLARTGLRWFLPLPALLGGKLAAMGLVALAPALIGARPVVDWAVQATLTGVPGLLILVLLTRLAQHLYPPGGGGGPLAAA